MHSAQSSKKLNCQGSLIKQKLLRNNAQEVYPESVTREQGERYRAKHATSHRGVKVDEERASARARAYMWRGNSVSFISITS